MSAFLKDMRGYRKFIVMLFIIVALSALLLLKSLTGDQFTNCLEFISAGFFAANFGGKLATKGNSDETKT